MHIDLLQRACTPVSPSTTSGFSLNAVAGIPGAVSTLFFLKLFFCGVWGWAYRMASAKKILGQNVVSFTVDDRSGPQEVDECWIDSKTCVSQGSPPVSQSFTSTTRDVPPWRRLAGNAGLSLPQCGQAHYARSAHPASLWGEETGRAMSF
jgi:hypothetical protein